jgi:uncharacterized damage-inducible protein DinB
MKESKRIIKLFENLYNGSPWIDVTIVPILKNITASQAAKKVLPNCNSIWEITNHIIAWRINVLKRIQGHLITTPSNNYIKEVKIITNTAWEATLKKLELTQKDWIIFLKKVKKEDFEKIYTSNNLTYYEHIQGIIQHDAYHLGQIVLLSKFIKN